MYKLNVSRSKTGLPTISESGGGSTNTGYAIIVCGANGEKLKPIFVPRGYSNGDHAIFVANVGMHFIEAEHSRSTESATVYRIDSIGNDEDENSVLFHEVCGYENGDGNITEQFNNAVESAINKSHCYHCREAHYYKA